MWHVRIDVTSKSPLPIVKESWHLAFAIFGTYGVSKVNPMPYIGYYGIRDDESMDTYRRTLINDTQSPIVVYFGYTHI